MSDEYKCAEWLSEQRVNQRRELQDIADECGVSRRTISYYITKYSIAEPLKDSEIYVEISCCECKQSMTKRLRYLRQRIRRGVYSFYCPDCLSEKQSRERAGELNGNYGGGFHGDPGIRLKGLLSQLSGKETSIERKMREELDRRGVKYLTQQPMSKFVVDFLLPDHRIVIECDGDYWHSRPDIAKRDKIKNQVVRQGGYSLYRFLGSEINKNVSECVDVVMAEVNAKDNVI